MRRVAWAYFILVAFGSLSLAFCASRVGAQEPDCNLAAKRWDNPISDGGGMYLRRYQWHIAYASASTLSAEFLHRATGLPRWASALSMSVAMGVLPHVRGISRGQYVFNARDWGFDLFNRAAPLVIWTGMSGQTWQSRTLAGTTILGGYFSLVCWASP
jgi:hypothetical protein